MAAMAPALTDAPAEAHHIRFKLAPPSSTLSPGSAENNSNASNILISSNGAVKRKALAAAAAGEEARSLDFRDGGREEPQPAEAAPPSPPTPLGKLQPLVASYLCSDVTSVPSTKESLKLQGVLIKQSVLKSHGILPNSYFGASDFLPRKRQTLELSGEQLKSLMSAGGQPPVANGLAKKLAKTGVDRDHAALVNGGRPPAGQDLATQAPPLEARPSVSKGDPAGQSAAPPSPRETAGTSCAAANGSEPAAYAAFAAPPGGRTDPGPRTPGGRVEGPSAGGGEEEEEGGGADGDGGLASPARDHRLLSPSGGLDSEVRDRTALSQSRQGEIEGRLRRLRKRLQVVQAKQVERHVQQQLGGFLQTTFSKLPSLDALRLRSPAVLTRKAEADLWRAASDPGAEDGLGRFLKGGSVPGELERLSLSGAASLRAAEGAFDSDATESSSGGETDVEEEELTRVDIEQRHISLWRRAEGRHALERASIVSHWNWLQAHISDLEYRIRQQTDIYRQIRTNKGSLELGDSAPCEAPAEEAPEVKAEAAACQGTQDGGSEGAERAASPRSPVAESGLWKASGPGRPVNGMIGSLRPGLPDRASSQSPDPEEQAGRKKQRLAPPQPLPSPPDGTCVAARTRPVLGCRKRRLVRPAAVASLGRKVQRIAGPRCGCCDVNPQCATCAGRPAPGADLPYERPLLERLSQLDPSVHPILSFPDDVSMGLHFQRVMKSHWHGKPLEKMKPLKKLSLKHKLSLGGRLHDPCSSSSSKDKHKLANSLLPGLRLSHHKMRPEKLHRGHLEGRSLCKGERGGQGLPPGAYDRGHGRKRPREHYPERTDANPKPCVDAGGPCSPLTGLHTPSHSPLVRQLSTSSEGSTPVGPGSQSATSTPQPIRRRRGESSFDINNIVIPMSVAATTRVEKLQYKEILTPSWREVDIFAKPIAEEDENVEIEDLTDTAFTQLHLPCEEQERSRWTWMASAPAKRRGSRSYKSLDGRTTPLLGGTTPSTPQPASPDAPHFHALQDYGPVPSPRSPASPDLPPAPRACSEDTRCSTPDFTAEELVPQTVQPWERRDFPLEEDPALEPATEQGGPEGEGPGRGARRASGSRAPPGCRTESESGPASPPPPASAQQ